MNKPIILLLFIFANLASSCNGQNSNTIQCKVDFKNAKKAFNSFYKERNEELLSEALKEVELSQSCPETRKASIELKVSILSLQKNYDKAFKFVESLDVNDFAKSYKKEMESNLLKALDYESKSDLKNKSLYLKKAIVVIESYINQQKTTDQEAYYDLFFIKSKMLSKNELDSNILLLEKQYPVDKDFFEALKESFNEQPKEIHPTTNK